MQDGFSFGFSLRRGEERFDSGPWRPMGTLAKDTFEAPHLPRGAEHLPPELLMRWLDMYGNAQQDLRRLINAPNATSAAQRLLAGLRYSVSDQTLALRDLGLVRQVIEELLQVPFPTWYHPVRRRPGRDQSAIVRRMVGRALRRTVRWGGCTKDEERFQTTLAGATLLSALYGRTRGVLRLCASCGLLMVSPRKGFQHKRCRACRQLEREPAAEGRASGLSLRQRDQWQKALGRMRRRGFRREGMVTKAQRQAWKEAALQGLRQAKSDSELEHWKSRFAPKATPGPRKRPHGRT
jgi:hypothetical protein